MKNNEHKWNIIKCPKCNKITAIPICDFNDIINCSRDNYSCYNCNEKFHIKNSNCGFMIANRGVVVETKLVLT